MTAGSPGKTESRPREWSGSALVVSADNSLRGRIQPFQAIQQSANVWPSAICRPVSLVSRMRIGTSVLPEYQHPADGHRIPLLAATKGWHLASVQFPRHSATAHKARCPECLNHGRQSPCALVGGNHVRQCTRCFTPPARTSNCERRIDLEGARVRQCRSQVTWLRG